MRSEKEVFELIITFARDHDDVRAVVMTGSRTNPAATPDRFQDFDITYLVEDVTPYRQNGRVPQYFGDIMILQMPDDMAERLEDSTGYAYLMQFTDGNRIDLTFLPVAHVDAILGDSLSVVLLDKDERFRLAPPTLGSYFPQKPTPKQFAECCNEFWWVNPYVAKGLYRDQIVYAQAMLNGPLREQLMAMLTWHIGFMTDFVVSVGQFGKDFKKHLPADLWDLLERTYSDARPDHIWNSLFVMNELFRKVAMATAEAAEFAYPAREDDAVSLFVRQIRDSVPRGDHGPNRTERKL